MLSCVTFSLSKVTRSWDLLKTKWKVRLTFTLSSILSLQCQISVINYLLKFPTPSTLFVSLKWGSFWNQFLRLLRPPGDHVPVFQHSDTCSANHKMRLHFWYKRKWEEARSSRHLVWSWWGWRQRQRRQPSWIKNWTACLTFLWFAFAFALIVWRSPGMIALTPAFVFASLACTRIELPVGLPTPGKVQKKKTVFFALVVSSSRKLICRILFFFSL